MHVADGNTIRNLTRESHSEISLRCRIPASYAEVGQAEPTCWSFAAGGCGTTNETRYTDITVR